MKPPLTTCLRGAAAAALIAVLLEAGPALACGACAPLVAARIAGQPFWPVLLVLGLPVAAVALMAWAIHRRGMQR